MTWASLRYCCLMAGQIGDYRTAQTSLTASNSTAWRAATEAFRFLIRRPSPPRTSHVSCHRRRGGALKPGHSKGRSTESSVNKNTSRASEARVSWCVRAEMRACAFATPSQGAAASALPGADGMNGYRISWRRTVAPERGRSLCRCRFGRGRRGRAAQCTVMTPCIAWSSCALLATSWAAMWLMLKGLVIQGQYELLYPTLHRSC